MVLWSCGRDSLAEIYFSSVRLSWFLLFHLCRLKSALMALGLKCGGTLQERAERYKYHHIYIKNKFYLLYSVYLLYLKVVPDSWVTWPIEICLHKRTGLLIIIFSCTGTGTYFKYTSRLPTILVIGTRHTQFSYLVIYFIRLYVTKGRLLVET